MVPRVTATVAGLGARIGAELLSGATVSVTERMGHLVDRLGRSRLRRTARWRGEVIRAAGCLNVARACHWQPARADVGRCFLAVRA